MSAKLRQFLVGASVALLLLASFGVAYWRYSTVPDEDFSFVHRMRDDRPAKEVTGSFWTKDLDCTYRDPPVERTLKVKAFDCAAADENVFILESGRAYFVPRSTADDEPPYCLVAKPASKSMVQVAREHRFIYCHRWGASK